ncbi:MAG: hypothetical protein JXC35_02765 [Acholeplasmataceae bacterium]|nr:hypothetical protein [Acholeplasmataceae bacterium]
MKRRIMISASMILLLIVLIPIAVLLFDLRDQGIFMIVMLVTFVYVGIYVFGGVPKLIVYSIYGIITTAILLSSPQPYHLPIAIIGSLLFVLNPLSSFESYLEKKMNEEDVLPLRISIRGSYWPFYSYQKEMKNFYHLPQARKLFTLKWYLHARQVLTVALVTLGTVVFINNLSNIANSLDDFSWINFFNFYSVIIIFILALFLYKKGFTSTIRTLVISVFPPVIFLVLISDFPDPIRYSFAGGTLIAFMVILGLELAKLYQRVAYDSYHYYDVDQQMEVYANALFEPLIYNESFTKCASFLMKVKPEEFQKQFHSILVYANYFRFIVTAYTIEKQGITIHAHFHYKNGKRIEKFKTFLESKFKNEVIVHQIDDPNKQQYEKKFFHRPDYIVARGLALANLLKELEIKTRIIVSMIVYFEHEEDLLEIQKIYSTLRLDDLSEDEYITARIDVPLLNVDYVIEAKIREMLLELLIHSGKFVRISVFY